MCISYVLTICPFCVFSDTPYFSFILYYIYHLFIVLCSTSLGVQIYFFYLFLVLFLPLACCLSPVRDIVCAQLFNFLCSIIFWIFIRLTKLSLSCISRLSFLHSLLILAALFFSLWCAGVCNNLTLFGFWFCNLTVHAINTCYLFLIQINNFSLLFSFLTFLVELYLQSLWFVSTSSLHLLISFLYVFLLSFVFTNYTFFIAEQC